MNIILPAALFVVASLLFSAPVSAQGLPRKGTSTPQLTVFPEGRDRLPANYEGVDNRKLLSVFKKSVASLKRRKTESAEQFKARAAGTEKVLRPISMKATYAFRVPELTAQYSAHRQAYVFGAKSGYGCPASGFLDGYVTCGIGDYPVAPMGKAVHAADSGAGGGSKDATRARREALGLAVQTESGFVGKSFTLDRNIFYFKQELPVSAETAERLKDYQVSVLFVGNVVEKRFVSDSGRVILPIVKNRRDATTLEYDLPFKVSKVVYYVYQTGEILRQTEF